MTSRTPKACEDIYGSEKATTELVAIAATYCFPFLPRYVSGFAFTFCSTLNTHTSLPVFESNARNRRSFVAPTKTSPPAVTIGPALPEPPTFCLPGGSASLIPSVVTQAMSPVFALTAHSFAQGGFWQGALPNMRPFSSRIGAAKPLYGPGPLMLPRSYGCGDPFPLP